jgi:hypothetical protein
MGCGCKKGNESQPAVQSNVQQSNVQQSAPPKPNVNEDVKSAIKKTIEKYYNVNKTNTNGWVKG